MLQRSFYLRFFGWSLVAHLMLARRRNLARLFAGIDVRPAVAQASALADDLTFKRERDDQVRRNQFPQSCVAA
jgi:hypothetical protein